MTLHLLKTIENVTKSYDLMSGDISHDHDLRLECCDIFFFFLISSSIHQLMNQSMNL